MINSSSNDSSLNPFKVINLKKSYTSAGNITHALKGIDLSMKQGEIFGLLGPNGAGKTTLISILTSLEVPTEGEAYIFGENVGQNLQSTKAYIGIVPQELISHGFFSIIEVLRFHSGYFGIKNNEKHLQFLLERLGLAPHGDKKVRELSGGMKRRFLIAKALVHKPKLLILDEPTAGVDIELRNSLWEFVKDLNRDGTSVLLTTHYLEEAEMLCPRVAIIHQGEVKAIGDTKTLVKDMTQRQIIIYVNSEVQTTSPYLVEKQADHMRFQIPSNMEVGNLMAQLKIDLNKITDIKIREGRLEDAFLSVLNTKKIEATK